MCTCTMQIDTSRADAFTERMLDVLNSGALALMTSIGHRTGLFDTMAEMAPASSAAIAARAGLNERYVREWLGAMAAARVVEYDMAARAYRLPVEHAAALTRAAAPNNVAAFAQYMAVLGAVEDGIVASFRRGGGVPYASFPRFQEVMAEESGQTVLPALFEHILPLVPGLIARLEKGIDVLDVGCGSGRALLMMAEAFPRSRFTGYEISPDGLERGRAEAERLGLTNARFAYQDAAAMTDEAAFDLVTTFDAVHDQAKPAAVLAGIRRALRPDGVYLMQDIAGSSEVQNNLEHPMGTFLYTISCMHCMTVSLAEGGDGLGAMWGEDTARRMLEQAGFASIEVHHLPHDVQNAYFVARRMA